METLTILGAGVLGGVVAGILHTVLMIGYDVWRRRRGIPRLDLQDVMVGLKPEETPLTMAGPGESGRYDWQDKGTR
jgi:hypothetical protein